MTTGTTTVVGGIFEPVLLPSSGVPSVIQGASSLMSL